MFGTYIIEVLVNNSIMQIQRSILVAVLLILFVFVVAAVTYFLSQGNILCGEFINNDQHFWFLII